MRLISGRWRWPVLLVTVVAVSLTIADCGLVGVAGDAEALTNVREDWVVGEAEAIAWHQVKDEHGPALTGNDSWRHFMTFVEEKLRGYGVVDLHHNAWAFDRWHTSEWPDKSHWSLISDGERVEVASYGANSGDTGPDGVTARLVFYDPQHPPADLTGRIVVFRTRFEPAMAARLAGYDFEYRSPYESYPEPGHPTRTEPTSQSFEIFAQLPQTHGFIDIAVKGKAAGALWVFDAGSEQMAGMYTFPAPPIYNVPTLYLDRNAGARVIKHARAGAVATLRLQADVTRSTAYQLIGFLPGRDYGKPTDEVIQLTTHTDGPSISQDNGALGLLGIVKYISNVPQQKRPRTLMVFLDCRHFMPGQEAAFADQDWFARQPQRRGPVVGMIGMEHLGQIEFLELGDAMAPSRRVSPSSLWTTHNEKMIGLAIKAVIDNKLPSAAVRDIDRPGIHGGEQGPWYGVAKVGREIGLPTFATMGYMGAYWATSSGIERFDATLFRRQVATFVQLTGELMTANLSELEANRPSDSAGGDSPPSLDEVADEGS